MWSYISLLVSAFFFFSFFKLIVDKISYGLYIYIYIHMYSSKSQGNILGIDLGTTYSRVAVMQGEVRLLTFEYFIFYLFISLTYDEIV